MLEIVYTCPLGGVCEEIREGKLHRCRGWVKMQGKDPQSEKVYDEWKCSLLEWNPILLVEGSQVARGNVVAVEGLRNSMHSGYTAVNNLLMLAGKERG